MYGGMHPGQHYDRFIYAAMLSRARIENAWSGTAEDPEAGVNEAAAPVEEVAAFDPEMLKNLAERAEKGEIQEAPAAMPSTRGFSAAAIEAARGMATAPRVAAPTSSNASGGSVPAAFRPKVARPTTGVSEAAASVVPLAFLKKKQATAPQILAQGTDGSEAYDPSKPPEGGSNQDLDQMKKDFQDKMQNTTNMLQDAQNQAGGPMSETGDQQQGRIEPFKPGDKDSEYRKTEVAAAVQNIVNLKMDQAKKAVESSKAYHASAPEPRVADPNQEARKRRKWDAEQEGGKMRVDTSDPTLAPDSIASSNVPSLRELSALARSDPSSDAPVLGELRAPGNASGQFTDASRNKTGAHLAREQKSDAAQGRRSRSRSRDRRRRRRSPSTSPETKKKRLFTDKPSFRLTGSSFSAASSKPPGERKRGGFDKEQAPDLTGRQDLPDWMKDMAAAPAPAQPVLGKKYLHMPRIMIEVLTHNGGEAIRACIEKSQAQIRVETMIEEPIGIVSVNGYVSIAETCIREILANKGLDLPPQDGLMMPHVPVQEPSRENMQDIQIPSELVRHFVGHRGCNLKAITQKLGHAVSIQILPSVLPGGFQRIQITGSSRQQARQMVTAHIDELKRQKLTLWGDTHSKQAQTPVPPPPPPSIDGIRI